MDEHLDVANLIKASIDLRILKKLYLLPRQRKLFNKQRRMAFKIDGTTSESGGNGSSDAELYNEASSKSLLRMTIKNNTDRRLLIGMLERDNDIEPVVRRPTHRAAPDDEDS